MTSPSTDIDDGGGRADGAGHVGAWRNIGAAVLGYLTIVAGMFFLMALLWRVMGPERAFEPGSWEVTGAWIGGSIAAGLLAAFTGGQVCGKVSRGGWGVRLLVGIVAALGVLVAVGGMAFPEAAGPRTGEIAMFEAMNNARQPHWITWLNPVLGVVGVLAGAKTVRS